MTRKNPKDMTFTTSKGHVFQLRPISNLFLQRFDYELRQKRPKPPIKEVKIVDTLYAQENPSDPHYVEVMKEWENDAAAKQAEFILSYGILDTPPKEWQVPEFIERSLSDLQKRGVWLFEILHEDELGELMEAILSLNKPTESGIAQAAESFRDDGQQSGNNGVGVQKQNEPSN